MKKIFLFILFFLAFSYATTRGLETTRTLNDLKNALNNLTALLIDIRVKDLREKAEQAYARQDLLALMRVKQNAINCKYTIVGDERLGIYENTCTDKETALINEIEQKVNELSKRNKKETIDAFRTRAQAAYNQQDINTLMTVLSEASSTLGQIAQVSQRDWEKQYTPEETSLINDIRQLFTQLNQNMQNIKIQQFRTRAQAAYDQQDINILMSILSEASSTLGQIVQVSQRDREKQYTPEETSLINYIQKLFTQLSQHIRNIKIQQLRTRARQTENALELEQILKDAEECIKHIRWGEQERIENLCSPEEKQLIEEITQKINRLR